MVFRFRIFWENFILILDERRRDVFKIIKAALAVQDCGIARRMAGRKQTVSELFREQADLEVWVWPGIQKRSCSR